jgi:molybdopterin molybdotransferase
MEFRGQPFAFDGPAAALRALRSSLGDGRRPWPLQEVPLTHARGRFLGAPVAADRDSPAFDQAVLDGYAVRRSDLAIDEELPVLGEARIGERPPPMPAARGAVRVSTGSAVPESAEAVIGREHVEERLHSASGGCIRVPADTARTVQPGQAIRRRGENLRQGDRLLPAGAWLGAAQVGALASVGCHRVPVKAPTVVHLLATGEELVGAEQEPGPFGTRDSNSHAVGGILGSRAWIQLDRQDRVRGEPADIDHAILQAGLHAHALVIMGGASMGHRDPVRQAVDRAGARVIFHGLPQRPGKPVLAAVLERPEGPGLLIFGLPGNPISAAVTAERLVVPALAGLCGGDLPQPPRLLLAEDDGRTLPLWWHRLVSIHADGSARLVPTQGSGDAPSAAASDGFVEVPPGERVGPDRPVPFHAWPG